MYHLKATTMVVPVEYWSSVQRIKALSSLVGDVEGTLNMMMTLFSYIKIELSSGVYLIRTFETSFQHPQFLCFDDRRPFQLRLLQGLHDSAL